MTDEGRRGEMKSRTATTTIITAKTTTTTTIMNITDADIVVSGDYVSTLCL